MGAPMGLPWRRPGAEGRALAQVSHTQSLWTVHAEHQAQVYCSLAQWNSSMNEKASLYYHRLDKFAIVAVSILTVITGSQSIPQIASAGSKTSTALSDAHTTNTTDKVLTVFLALCSIALGTLASIVTRLDWRGKAQAYSRRALGYGRLAASIRLQLILEPGERDPARDALERISETMGVLEDMADPLPLQYRETTRVNQGITSMWGGSSTDLPSPSHDPMGRTAELGWKRCLGRCICGRSGGTTRFSSVQSAIAPAQTRAPAHARAPAPASFDTHAHTQAHAMRPPPLLATSALSEGDVAVHFAPSHPPSAFRSLSAPVRGHGPMTAQAVPLPVPLPVPQPQPALGLEALCAGVRAELGEIPPLVVTDPQLG